MVTWTGRSTNETDKGTNAADILEGMGGADVLRGMGGNDQIDGGADNDQLTGDAGADELTGGAGTDTFDYNSVSDSGTSAGQWSALTGDTIKDFSRTQGDKIDLRDLAEEVSPVLVRVQVPQA